MLTFLVLVGAPIVGAADADVLLYADGELSTASGGCHGLAPHDARMQGGSVAGRQRNDLENVVVLPGTDCLVAIPFGPFALDGVMMVKQVRYFMPPSQTTFLAGKALSCGHFEIRGNFVGASPQICRWGDEYSGCTADPFPSCHVWAATGWLEMEVQGASRITANRNLEITWRSDPDSNAAVLDHLLLARE